MTAATWIRRYGLTYPPGATAGFPGSWLATVVLTSDGHFFANSDFGSYGYHWGGVSGDFRLSLLRFGDDYVLGKIATDSEYDGEATLKQLRERLDESLAEGDMTASEHAAEIDKIGWHNHLSDLCGFWGWYHDTELDDASEVAAYAFPNDARLFVEHVMPALRAAIRSEVETEGALADMPDWDSPAQPDHLADLMAEVAT